MAIGMAMAGTQAKQPVNADEVARKVRLDYLYSQKDQNQKVLDGIQVLLEHFQRHDFNLDAFVNDALNLMRRRLWLREVTVALLDREDGLYKYRYQSGLRKEAWEAHIPLSYKAGDLINPAVYKGREVSKLTTLFLAEDNPYGKGEDDTYSRPIMLQSKRLYADESVEGDYFDTWLISRGKEIVGWLEYSGTTANKLPDAAALKWIELIASLASIAFQLSEAKAARPKTPAPSREDGAPISSSASG